MYTVENVANDATIMNTLMNVTYMNFACNKTAVASVTLFLSGKDVESLS